MSINQKLIEWWLHLSVSQKNQMEQFDGTFKDQQHNIEEAKAQVLHTVYQRVVHLGLSVSSNQQVFSQRSIIETQEGFFLC